MRKLWFRFIWSLRNFVERRMRKQSLSNRLLTIKPLPKNRIVRSGSKSHPSKLVNIIKNLTRR
jgi:hypothetical protein